MALIRCGTGWGYGERIKVALSGQDAGMLPDAQDLLALARFAWARGEAIVADQAQPVYLRDKVATPRPAEARVNFQATLKLEAGRSGCRS